MSERTVRRGGRTAGVVLPGAAGLTGRGDLGLFGPGSVTWRVHAEPVLWVAGVRSLFLQALHPRAIAGVVQNSSYKVDPWSRLLRTADYVGTVIFGTTEQARTAGRRIRAIHARLRGVDRRTGETFRIDEPELLRWVHVTEVESFVSTARRAGVELTDADVDGYYTEQLRAAELVGLDPATVPGTRAEVAAYYRRVRPELALTREALDTLFFLLAPPLPWHLGLTPARLVYTGLAATAFALQPGWARRVYGTLGLPTTDLSASVSVRGLRLTMRLLPDRFRHGPIYRDAMARVAAQHG
ncbi:oxygenase MpaB family protein [Catellatospora sp. NPDC049609]|uniref:oxygenase MpaB family protein n=1 Tax=Catellatospora sp. NPDC049609 TaxID=3155505 RepID=UPI003441D61F